MHQARASPTLPPLIRTMTTEVSATSLDLGGGVRVPTAVVRSPSIMPHDNGGFTGDKFPLPSIRVELLILRFCSNLVSDFGKIFKDFEVFLDPLLFPFTNRVLVHLSPALATTRVPP
jgi:hypothetical protein